MIKEIRIKSLAEYLTLVADQKEDTNHRYRGYYLYRGLPDSTYKLQTSLQRNCGDDPKVRKALEKGLLRNFAKYTATEQMKTEESIWRNMMLGQHHGLPTRLLDWTHSPFMALHFAVANENFADIDKTDCVVWRIDASEINAKLPKPFQDEMESVGGKIFSIDMINHVANTIDDYDKYVGDKSMAILEPPSIDPRMVNQYAFFSIVPNAIDDIEKFLDDNTEKTVKYIIPKELKWQIRDFLDESNISERSVYPGLDGICKWLARHYYVKKREE